MKNRHQLFGNWVYSFHQSHKIRDKAIKMIKRQQEQHLDDSFNSSLSVRDQTSTRDAKWLLLARERSQELFYGDIKDLLLQREHLCAQVSRV